MNTTKTAACRLGRMLCFHPRYRLGGAHGYEDPEEFLMDLVESAVEPRVIVDYVLAGNAKWVQLQPNLDDEGWEVICDIDQNGTWEAVDSLAAIRGHWPEVAEAVLNWLDKQDLLTLARDHFVILPVILPDADTPTLQTRLSAPPWSEGQIGWIYAEREAVLKRFGGAALDEGARAKAEAVLQAEVESRSNPQRRRAKQSVLKTSA